MREKFKNRPLSVTFGFVRKISPTQIEGSGLKVGIGDMVRIDGAKAPTLGIISALEGDRFVITPLGFVDGLKTGDPIYCVDGGMSIGVSRSLLGRVINPFGAPIDGRGDIRYESWRPIMNSPIEPMKRSPISSTFLTRVRSIDTMLTTGKGQKVGIFAGSGVGKSTLMGMIVRGSDVPVKVVALIGERGREIPEFIADSLGGDLTNTVIVAATSDDSPLLRKFGAFAAMSIAEYFKDAGFDVLFMMDSITRFAMAQREIGLSLGEPPTSKGYPPSVFRLLPQLMERAGSEREKGSITAFFTVLVEGDDLSDPIADQARSILDGHIVLSRRLTELGLYPPIDILSSNSRLMQPLIDDDHRECARLLRRLLALLRDNEVLVRIGAYTAGSDRELDSALRRKEAIERFMSQEAPDERSFDECVEELEIILGMKEQKRGSQ
ncbi:MAG: flagellar protein export ATPase FliI [Helicobacteraceae bacterium]|jgi:flagellum-specific ATP synthase|nr:flagellar protein export ATPase FliI [Helicobacteraceae bacterium]